MPRWPSALMLGLLAVGLLVSPARLPAQAPGKKVVWPKVGSVQAELRERLSLADHYEKHADADGLPVVASKKVDDRALAVAAVIVNKMLATRPDVRQALIDAKVRIGIIGATEETTDLPEYTDLDDKPKWNKRARGLGATTQRPAVSAGEENLLGYPLDRYKGESILVHEFAHTYHELGLNAVDSEFEGRLKTLHEKARDKGLWANTYAAANEKEYWAEAVQSYFDANMPVVRPNEVHNGVHTRERLKAYDPEMFKLIDGVFKSEKWRWQPPVPGVTIPAPVAPKKKK